MDLIVEHLVMKKKMRVAMIAGEPSGDFLGAGLIAAMQTIEPTIEFIGIGGPLMRELGFDAVYPMEQIAVMGISDVLRCYPRLKWIHHKMTRYLINNPPDLFVGIDAPDFNLRIEVLLKQRGVKTAHYVCPKFWAWRPERVHQIQKAVDLLLSVFPFELPFCEPYGIPVKYVGHPLADLIDLTIDTVAMKEKWGYASDQTVIAVLPGSRHGELRHMGPLFIDVMQQIQLSRPDIQFIVPLGSDALREPFTQQLKDKNYPLNLQIVDKHSREVLGAADVVLVKSGTSTLEAALLKKPMVVAFKMSWLSHRIIAARLLVPYIALPNLLANQLLVPEFIQDDACPAHMARAVLDLLEDQARKINLEQKFINIHLALRQGANQQAATALFKLVKADSLGHAFF